MAMRAEPRSSSHFRVTLPAPHILQITLTRPDRLNCIDKATSRQIAAVWERFDQDESLWVAIITGEGRAFCTGADLHEWNDMNRRGIVNDMSAPGLAGLPRRAGKKPIIAAVNGVTMGGGFEMVANCDLIVAAATAVFALPEVKRGIVPVAGCLPRLTRTIGLQRTMDLVLTGRSITAQTLLDWGLVNRIIESQSDVVPSAIKLAQELCQNSPDALFIGRLGTRMAWQDGDVERSVDTLAADWYPRLMAGENFKEGIEAFVQKRPPVWVDSKL